MNVEPFGADRRLSIAPTFYATCAVTTEFVAGEIFHVDRNPAGGSNRTPVARFFAWRPANVENFNPHWRVDCFVRVHELSPEPKTVATSLANGLLREAICTQPLWVSWHQSEERGGTNFGDVLDLD